jgi:flagella basal body P-ring formation protein FlgA
MLLLALGLVLALASAALAQTEPAGPAAQAAPAPSAPAAGVRVQILPKVLVRGQTVLLADIAEIKGPDTQFKRDLAGVAVAESPAPGQKTTLTRALLSERLYATGLPLDQAEWRVPENVVVAREYQVIQPDMVEQVVLDHLRRIEPYMSGDWRLVGLKTGPIPKLPVGQVETRPELLPGSNPAYPRINVHLLVDGAAVGIIRASGRVEMSAPAVVAARRLEKGQPIEPGDLVETMVKMDQIRPGTLRSAKEALGLVCRTQIREGDTVQSRDFIPLEVVKTGAMVTIVAQSGPLKVTTTGQAKRGGAVGQDIPVVNTQSKKTLVARIIGPDTVQVNF